ncbi:MAG: hypothetical protein BM564_12765 [Bacteroidetes bacterium MedPE-SWsnd-G2]|nr:MAG: hypothetical protein BM564_12765 [Bacteroidetes bacterium MedPE-SWsnd-G2]
MNNKKELLIGCVVGLIANSFGLIFSIQIFGETDDYGATIKQALAEGFFGKLVSLGALLNLIAFFVFLKKNQDKRAQGVLLITVIIALFTFAIKSSY